MRTFDEQQFEMISSNSDVYVADFLDGLLTIKDIKSFLVPSATLGRLLHLIIVEMDLDLKSIQFVMFDEADQQFKMGFDTALNEILKRLPSSLPTSHFSCYTFQNV